MTDTTEIETLMYKVEVAQEAINKWLRRHGWKESSRYPDSVWRWSKEIDGKILAVNRVSAVEIERALSIDD